MSVFVIPSEIKPSMRTSRGISSKDMTPTTILLCLGMIVSVFAAPVQNKNCPVGKYHDHGTDNCEPCSDICESAEIKRTLKDCNDLCPGYHLPIQQAAASNGRSSSSTSPNKAMIIAVVVGLLVVVTVLVGGFFFFRSRTEQQNGRGTTTATGTNRAAGGRYHNPPSGVQEENEASDRMMNGQPQRLARSWPGLLSVRSCDPRAWLGWGPYAEETPAGRQGRHELVVTESQKPDLQRSTLLSPRSPIYRPSGPVPATRV